MTRTPVHTAAGTGRNHLMLGTDVISTLLGGEDTAGEIALVEAHAPPGGGPQPHVDPWRESFYVLEGELRFEIERDGGLERLDAGEGDVVSIPSGLGHGFTIVGEQPARYLVMTVPAGLERFFADAGEELQDTDLPVTPRAFDRERLSAAFARHGLLPYSGA
jgi:quercetin dioxygenase-like cupin family protein